MPFAIGADLGGTKLATVVLDERGEVVRRDWHDRSAGDDTLVMLRSVLRELIVESGDQGHPIAAVGVSIAAWMDTSRRHLVHGANLGLADVDLGELARSITALPVAIANDGDSTAWGEYRAGVARDARTVCLFTLGTGVGGGVIVDGRLWTGARGLGGELGHLPVTDDPSVTCACGGIGCVEHYAGGGALGAAATALRDSGGAEVLLGVRPDGPVSARDLADAVAAGDAASGEIVRVASRHLARAIGSASVLLDPELVVLGGSVMDGLGTVILHEVRLALAAASPLDAVRGPVKVVAGRLGPSAAAIGAAHLALDLVP
jgi:glucokinase